MIAVELEALRQERDAAQRAWAQARERALLTRSAEHERAWEEAMRLYFEVEKRYYTALSAAERAARETP